MELVEVMRAAGSVRRFRSDPVPVSTIYEVLDNARFAPSGGNRQGWRVIVVTDPALRRSLGELFRTSWYTLHAPLYGPARASQPDAYADQVHEVPVHLVVLIAEQSITTTIEALDTSRVVGGASIYPFVHNILLGLRDCGLGSALTTVLVPMQPQLNQLLAVPDGYITAAHLAVGWPADPLPTRLRRKSVEQFATINGFTGPPLRPANER
jgi:nitroreductase